MAVTFIKKKINTGYFISSCNYGEIVKKPINQQSFIEKNTTIPTTEPVKVELVAFIFDYADITVNEFDNLDLTTDGFNYWLPIKGG